MSGRAAHTPFPVSSFLSAASLVTSPLTCRRQRCCFGSMLQVPSFERLDDDFLKVIHRLQRAWTTRSALPSNHLDMRHGVNGNVLEDHDASSVEPRQVFAVHD